MVTAEEVLFGVAMVLGVLGVVVPVLPGSLLVGAVILVWATETGGPVAWTVLGVAAAALVTAGIGKWLLARRKLQGAGVHRAAVVAGGVGGIIGFVVIPVVGLLLGFLAGVYLVERLRLHAHDPARRATVAALKASGVAILTELFGALIAATAWVVGVLWT